MISDKQLDANRANAQKSTGPRTEEGKKRSRLNAFRHGLSSQVFVMPEEEAEVFNQFIEELTASFEPADLKERQLAQAYAGCQWRINRAAALENNLLTLGLMEEVAENLNIPNAQAHNASTFAKTFRMDGAEMARISMYSQRIVNQSEKILSQLQRLQAERKEKEQNQMFDAMVAYKNFQMLNETFNPQANGFVLTTSQVEAHMHRQSIKNPVFVADFVRRQRAKAA